MASTRSLPSGSEIILKTVVVETNNGESNKEEKGKVNVEQGSEVINKLGRGEDANNAAGFELGSNAHAEDGAKVEVARSELGRKITEKEGSRGTKTKDSSFVSEGMIKMDVGEENIKSCICNIQTTKDKTIRSKPDGRIFLGEPEPLSGTGSDYLRSIKPINL